MLAPAGIILLNRQMDKKLPLLYSRPGKIVDFPNENWFESKVYSLEDLKNEIKHLGTTELFFFLIDIVSKDRVNVDVFASVIGLFDKVTESFYYCSCPYNQGVTACTVTSVVENNYPCTLSINFSFKHKVPLSDKFSHEGLMIDSKEVNDRLRVKIMYPVLFEKDIAYTNQLIMFYESSPPPVVSL